MWICSPPLHAWLRLHTVMSWSGHWSLHLFVKLLVFTCTRGTLCSFDCQVAIKNLLVSSARLPHITETKRTWLLLSVPLHLQKLFHFVVARNQGGRWQLIPLRGSGGTITKKKIHLLGRSPLADQAVSCIKALVWCKPVHFERGKLECAWDRTWAKNGQPQTCATWPAFARQVTYIAILKCHKKSYSYKQIFWCIRLS